MFHALQAERPAVRGFDEVLPPGRDRSAPREGSRPALTRSESEVFCGEQAERTKERRGQLTGYGDTALSFERDAVYCRGDTAALCTGLTID